MSFWSETPTQVPPGTSLPIHVHSPDEGGKMLTIRADGEQVLVGLDDAGRGLARFSLGDRTGLVILSHPNIAHFPVWVGEGEIPEKYRSPEGELIIPPEQDPGEDPDPALLADPESASEGEVAADLKLRPGEEPVTPPAAAEGETPSS